MNRFLRQKPKLIQTPHPTGGTTMNAPPPKVVKLDPNSQLAKAFQAAHAKLNPDTPDAA